ncbi:MAG: hypothetical protein AB7V43_21130 [Acidimicrobiia bacterium]
MQPQLRSAAHDGLRSLLHQALVGRSEPVCFFDDATVPAISAWAGARAWVRALRRAGVVAGDRVVISVADRPVAFEVIIACLWEGVCAIPVDAGNVAWAMRATDARVAIVGREAPDVRRRSPEGGDRGFPAWEAYGLGDPAEPLHEPLPAGARRDTALLLHGATGWVPMGAARLVSIATHGRLAPMLGARAVSTVDWGDPAGLLYGIIAPVLRSCAVLVAIEPMGLHGVDDEVLEMCDEATWLTSSDAAIAHTLASHPDALGRCRGLVAIVDGSLEPRIGYGGEPMTLHCVA